MNIPVWFSCNECGLKNVKIMVAPRISNAPEDVVSYMESVVLEAIRIKHSILSPVCRSGKVQNVCFPIPKNARWLGDPTADYPTGELPPENVASLP